MGRAITAGSPEQNRELEKGPNIDKKGHSAQGYAAQKEENHGPGEITARAMARQKSGYEVAGQGTA